MNLFKKYIEKNLRKKFNKTEQQVILLFESLAMVNKPTLEFNYNSDKYKNCEGIYYDLLNEKPNHILINLTQIKNKQKVIIVLCHELGHYYHFTERYEDFIKLKLIRKNSKKGQTIEFLKAVTTLENCADEYGKLFAKKFGCFIEFDKYATNIKREREELDIEYLAIMAQQPTLSLEVSL